MRASGFTLAILVATAGCYSNQGTDGEESPFPEPTAVALEDDVTSQQPVIVMRLTNGASIDPHVYDSLNRIANEQLDLGDLLMKGGLPRDDDGTELVPATPDVAGTAPEQLAHVVENGMVTAADATDACGNPQVATFVTPRMLQHAGLDDTHPNWPAACPDAQCDTLTWGTIEVVPSAVRFDGMMDMIINVHPDAITGAPGLWGHVLGWFLTPNNPGFTEAPLIVSAKRFQLLMLNLWQDQKTYEHPGVGTRQVLAVPHVERSVERAADLILTLGPQTPEECKARWEADHEGVVPFGCDEGLPVLVDRTAPQGQELNDTFLKGGVDPTAVDTLRKVFEYQLQAALACPGAGVDDTAWVKDGPVELFLCPDGDLDVCLAREDMEEYACNPVEETRTVQTPLTTGEVFALTEQREPYVFQGDELSPVAGYVLEITVDDDTVLYLSEPERVLSITGPSGVVDFPTPVGNTHCDEEPAFRYDVGGVWGPGTYTLEVPSTLGDDELVVHVTSVPTWVF